MVIKGAPRGNGLQLGGYLLKKAENDSVRILEVSGSISPDADILHAALFDMSVLAELTKSNKGLYHAQINPDPNASQTMSDAQWFMAADILGQELWLQDQRRVIVLHEKKGRVHAHCVWQRYDAETDKVVSDSFSRLAQDRARKKMEQVFEQLETPHRNKHRPELKTAITALWNATKTGDEFITAIEQTGYMIAAGVPKTPFRVIDEHGHSFDLNRQVKGAKLKDLRTRLRYVKLVKENEAIEIMRLKKATGGSGSQSQTAQDQQKPNTPEQDDKATARHIAHQFAENRNKAVYGVEYSPGQGEADKSKEAVKKEKAQEPEPAPEPDEQLTSFEEQLQRLQERNRNRKRGRGR